MIESRRDGAEPFTVIADAMRELRRDEEATGREAQREAYMRTVLRKALREGFERIAVVCGAWHVPALEAPLPPATHDARILKGLPKRKVACTWVPWTHGRLAAASGYGAGITSPGWYHHLFTAPDQITTRWLSKVARVLRAEDLPVSSAHVIEAVRLADTLAALRGRPLAGLSEVTEATRAVLCGGNDVLLDLVTREAVVGELLGDGAGGDAAGAGRGGSRGAGAAAADEAGRDRAGDRARPAQAERPGEVATAAPAADSRRALGRAGRRRAAGAGHVPGDVAADLGSRPRGRAGRRRRARDDRGRRRDDGDAARGRRIVDARRGDRGAGEVAAGRPRRGVADAAAGRRHPGRAPMPTSAT